jgi:hypothetical protein
VFPWSARLGVATVPELPAAALTLLAMASIVPPTAPTEGADRRRIWGAIALLAATLSRYEAWPVAAAFALICLAEARTGSAEARTGSAEARTGSAEARTGSAEVRTGSAEARTGSAEVRTRSRAASIGAALIAIAGPAAWIAWNRVAHGDPIHFLARVAAYRKALGGAEPGGLARLTAYPAAMAREEPELIAILALALIAAFALKLPGLRDRIRRFARPAALTLIQIAALSFAMIKDGAPTHHPERAVLVAFLLAAVVTGALAADLARVASARQRILGAIGAALAIGLAAALIRPTLPSEGFTARKDEVAIGRAAAALMPEGTRALVEVVDYGHLAVVAALGRPEDAVLDRSIDPRDPPVRSSFEVASALAARIDAAGAAYVIARPSPITAQILGEPATIAGALAIWRAPAKHPLGSP